MLYVDSLSPTAPQINTPLAAFSSAITSLPLLCFLESPPIKNIGPDQIIGLSLLWEAKSARLSHSETQRPWALANVLSEPISEEVTFHHPLLGT